MCQLVTFIQKGVSTPPGDTKRASRTQEERTPASVYVHFLTLRKEIGFTSLLSEPA